MGHKQTEHVPPAISENRLANLSEATVFTKKILAILYFAIDRVPADKAGNNIESNEVHNAQAN
jgi:hypothetical protein